MFGGVLKRFGGVDMAVAAGPFVPRYPACKQFDRNEVMQFEFFIFFQSLSPRP